MKITRKEAISAILGHRNHEALVVLERDRQLQVVLAVWRMLDFTETAQPKSAARPTNLSGWIAIAWSGIEMPVAQASALAGEYLPVAALLQRAALLGLGLPDGSVHPVADGWLAAESARIAQGMLSKSKKQ
jgi:hypothetical protein